MDIDNLNTRVIDLEDKVYENAYLIDVMLGNQVVLAETLNQLINYMNVLFVTGVQPLKINMEEPEGEE